MRRCHLALFLLAVAAAAAAEGGATLRLQTWSIHIVYKFSKWSILFTIHIAYNICTIHIAYNPHPPYSLLHKWSL